MKQALKINLGGQLFFIDEDAYLLLKNYLDELEIYFSKEKEGSREIYEDIEIRISELLHEKLTGGKEVISIDDVKSVISRMGKIEDFERETDTGDAHAEEESYQQRKSYRKLYRDTVNSYLGGVASGLGAYFGIDPLWVRVIFFVLVFANGAGIILYIILWIVVPPAVTTAQRLQMKGKPVNISNIEKTVNEEFHKVKESMGRVTKSKGYQRTRDSLNDVGNILLNILGVLLKIIIWTIGIVFILTGLIFLIGISTTLFFGRGFINWFHWPDWNIHLPWLSDLFVNPENVTVISVCWLIVILIPVIALIYGGIKLLFNIRTRNRALGATAFTAWILALILLIVMTVMDSGNYTLRSYEKEEHFLDTRLEKTLYIDINERKFDNYNLNVFTIFDYSIQYDKNQKTALKNPAINIESTYDTIAKLFIDRQIKEFRPLHSEYALMEYDWNLYDTVLVFDEFFLAAMEQRWRMPRMELTLLIPENQSVWISKRFTNVLGDLEKAIPANNNDFIARKCIMTPHGLDFNKEK